MIRTNRARAVGVAHLLLGAALVTRPHEVAAAVAGSPKHSVKQSLVRLLGMRSLVQGTAVALRPQTFITFGGVVDGIHAASMLLIAATDRRYRRTATISAALAAAYAGAACAGCRG